MDPNIVHRQFLPGYSDPATWSSILYNYGGQGPASQLHDLRAEQPRALPHDSHSQRQQITGHDIAEFFARNAPPPVTILNECHLQPQQQHPVSTAPHDVVLDLGLSAVVTPKKNDKEPVFIQDSTERSRFDKRRLKSLKSTLTGWYKRSGCVTIALTYLDGQVHVSGPDHMMSLSRNEEFKNVFLNTLTSYDQLSRLADIVSNCNEEESATEQLNAGAVQPTDIPDDGIVDHGSEPADYSFLPAGTDQGRKKQSEEPLSFDQDCKICAQRFTSKHFLKKHMLEVHNEATPMLTCTFCKKRFMTRWKLERHTISHTGAKPYNCIYCPKRFAEKNKLVVHIKTHKEDFVDAEAVERLIASLQPKRAKPYNCIYCPKRFAEKNKLVVHVKNHKEDFVDAEAVERLIASLLPKRKTSHDCTICGKSFLSSWKLNRHVRIHSGEKPFKCSKCPKSFIEKSKLDQHEQLPHDGSRVKGGPQDKRHECNKCGKKFVSQWKLKRHELFHSGERPWQCDQCGKGFVENNKLTLHKKFFHSDKDSSDLLQKSVVRSKKYKCTDCDKKFATQWKLKRHSQTHSLERPFRCEVCKRGFLTKNKLDLHNFTFHSEDGQEPLSPKAQENGTAGEGVNSISADHPVSTGEVSKSESEPLKLPAMAMGKESMKDFVVVEDQGISRDPISATVNDVTLLTTDPSAIKDTIEFDVVDQVAPRLASESKTCNECGKVFKTPSRLKRHMAVHTGVRPFKCKLCDKGFTERNKLLNHVKSHGVENPEGILESTARKEEDDGSTQQLPGGKHHCTICNRNFVSPWKLKRHQTIHTGKKPFYCKICQKAFAEKNKLENHVKSNHPTDLLEQELSQAQASMVEPESTFSIVGRTVDEQTDEEDDEKVNLDLEPVAPREHSTESTKQCDICKVLFDSFEDLNSHIQTRHGEDNSAIVILEERIELAHGMKKPLKYSCQICGKSFITPSKLKRHSFSHGELKPFKCRKCGKRFSENNKLFNHLVTHEKPRPSKAFPKLKVEMKSSVETRVETVTFLEQSKSLLAAKALVEAGDKKQPPVSSSQRGLSSDHQIISDAQQRVDARTDLINLESTVPSSRTTADSPQQVVVADRRPDVPGVVLTPRTIATQNFLNFATALNSQDPQEAIRNKIDDLCSTSSDHAEQSPDLPVVFTRRDIIQSNSEKLKMLVENAIGHSIDERPENAAGGKNFNEVLTSGDHMSRTVSVPVEPLSAAKQQVLNYPNGAPQMSLNQGTKASSHLYSCDICLESFLSAMELMQHKSISHASIEVLPQVSPNELKYKCTECNKGFKTPSKLKRHLLSHTGETPFHCELCPKQFKRKDSLRKHIEEHNRGK